MENKPEMLSRMHCLAEVVITSGRSEWSRGEPCLELAQLASQQVDQLPMKQLSPKCMAQKGQGQFTPSSQMLLLLNFNRKDRKESTASFVGDGDAKNTQKEDKPRGRKSEQC